MHGTDSALTLLHDTTMNSPALPKKRYGKPMSAQALRVWQKVRDAGGWWSVSELALDLGLDSETVRDTTRNLLRYKYFRQRKNTLTGLVTVGVTAFCYPPRGQTLEPVKLCPKSFWRRFLQKILIFIGAVRSAIELHPLCALDYRSHPAGWLLSIKQKEDQGRI